MVKPFWNKILILGASVLLAWFALKYLFPLLLPFLLGALLALAAEPGVSALSQKLHLPRPAASVMGVSTALLLLLGCVFILSSLLVKRLGTMSTMLPQLADSAAGGLHSLELYLHTLAGQAPERLREPLNDGVTRLFRSGGDLTTQLVGRLPNALTGLVGAVSSSALSVGAGILSAFMFSIRLPQLRQWLQSSPPAARLTQYRPVLRRIKNSLWGWLKAQLSLSGISFLILTAGFLLLGISIGPVWAFLTALVDAVPILGTGTVLLPWALVCFVQGNTLRATGLLILYVTTFLARTALEPRLVGKQIGLDPLITLISLYVGFQLWGIPGLLLAPMAAVVIKELSASPPSP